MPCAIWYHLYDLKNVKNTPMVYPVAGLYKWYQIVQSISIYFPNPSQCSLYSHPPLKTLENPVVYNRKIGLKSVKNIALIIKNIFQD